MRVLGLARRVLFLPIREQVSYLRLVGLTMGVELALRIFSLGTILRTLQVRTKWTDENADDGAEPALKESELKDVRRVVKLMRNWPFVEGACLRQALVLALLLRRHQPLLCLGVTKLDGQIHAHAWIEIAGGTLGHQQGFVPFRMAQAGPWAEQE